MTNYTDSHTNCIKHSTHDFCQVDPSPKGFDWNSVGVYFDFRPEPSLRTFKDVYDEWSRSWNEFVFSLIPGKLAFYFFHEGELFVCRR